MVRENLAKDRTVDDDVTMTALGNLELSQRSKQKKVWLDAEELTRELILHQRIVNMSPDGREEIEIMTCIDEVQESYYQETPKAAEASLAYLKQGSIIQDNEGSPTSQRPITQQDFESDVKPDQNTK